MPSALRILINDKNKKQNIKTGDCLITALGRGGSVPIIVCTPTSAPHGNNSQFCIHDIGRSWGIKWASWILTSKCLVFQLESLQLSELDQSLVFAEIQHLSVSLHHQFPNTSLRHLPLSIIPEQYLPPKPPHQPPLLKLQQFLEDWFSSYKTVNCHPNLIPPEQLAPCSCCCF